MGLGKYIKKAFLFHWNLLVFLGAMGFALLSGHPDVAVPLVLAGETAYLGFLGTHPRFQKFVDAQEHKAARAQADALVVERLLKALPPAQRRRFQALRDRCVALRQIAEEIREPAGADSLRALDEIQLSDLDRLLWIYLRTLYTQHMLERFFDNTSGDQIQAEIQRVEDRIRRLENGPNAGRQTRILQSLHGNLETCRARLANLEQARENYDLLQAEIGNLETKIQSITEMAVNRSDAEAITAGVEQITQGLVRTEQTINELGFVTGAPEFDLTVPIILSRQTAPQSDAEQSPPIPQRERRMRFSSSKMSRGTIPSVVPRLASLFEPVRDRYGWRLALVFGNHAPGGLCPYVAAQRCFHCDIGSGEGAAFDHQTNLRRLAWFRDRYQPVLASIDHLVLYNSGSVLNPREMPTDVLREILAFARSLPAVRVISLDSRESYIRPGTLRRILHCLGEGYMVRPILGIETADGRIRDEILQKRMPRSAIARVFRDLSELAAERGAGTVGLDVNVVIAGPGTSGETAVDDALATARLALGSGLAHGVKVNLNLHPYYKSHRGSARFPNHPRCSLATTVQVVRAVASVVRSMAADASLFIGWQDEGHDLDRAERERVIEHARTAFDHFNQTNDPNALDGLV